MEIVRNSVMDWEPLTLTILGKYLQVKDVEHFTRTWFADRCAAQICECYEKSLSVGPDTTGVGIVVDCEWMCERCLDDYCRRLQVQFPNVTQVTIGHEAVEAAGAESPAAVTRRKSSYVDVAEKSVEFEDGRRVFVPGFRIARKAVARQEFLEFVGATSYETTAQRNGLPDTFLNHRAMSPYKQERLASAVKCISFYDAAEYCQWKEGIRMPTEIEWLAASIVDDRIYDELTERDKVWDDKGRLRQMSHPDALDLDCEWTSTEGANGIAVVRCGPQWVRFTDWRGTVRSNRRLTDKAESSFSVGFRVVIVV